MNRRKTKIIFILALVLVFWGSSQITLAGDADAGKAKAYVKNHGGSIYKFDDITMVMLRPDMHANPHSHINFSHQGMKKITPSGSDSMGVFGQLSIRSG